MGTCPEDGAMPFWDTVSRHEFYSAQVTEFWEETGTLLFSDSSVTGADFIGAFSIAVNDAGVAKRFEDYNTAIGVKDGAPLDIPGYWNVTYTQDAKTLLLSQQEALRAFGEKNGYKSGFPVIISCVCVCYACYACYACCACYACYAYCACYACYACCT